ncbi:MAG: low molecular weight protein-tyrosine-phosphatase [Pseudomonadota bacterium]
MWYTVAMRYPSILLLCTGNICRSPMAQAVLQAELAARSVDVAVESAGTGALVDHPADPIAIELMAERGLDIEAHRGRQLTGGMLRAFPLILVMESGQRRHVERRWPLARGRVHDLGRWSDFDVPDPYKAGRGAFESSLALIDRGVDDWLGKLHQ